MVKRRCRTLKQRTNLGRSIDVAIYLNGSPIGGQQGAIFQRQAQMINITNKINPEWQENLAGTKSWNITCSGVYVVNDTAFSLLEDAFMNNKEVEVSIDFGAQRMVGRALITDFPLSAVYNKEFKYSIKMLGTGPLTTQEG